MVAAAACADAAAGEGAWLARHFAGRAWIAVELMRDGRDRERLAAARALGRAHDLPLTAAGDVHMHVRERRRAAGCAHRRAPRRHARGGGLAAAPERRAPPARDSRGSRSSIHRSCSPKRVKIAALANFSLDELRYEYPRELVPEGETPASHLRKLTEAGARRRWPAGIPEKMRAQIDYELALINDLAYESYFLTVHDIVSEARRLNILCQGRGSAANSVVCYCARASPRSIRRAASCSWSVSSRASATSRRTSTSISSTSGAKRSSSTSTASTDGIARRSPPR